MRPKLALILNISGIVSLTISLAVSLAIYSHMKGQVISLVDQLCQFGPCATIAFTSEGFILLPAFAGIMLVIAGTRNLYEKARTKPMADHARQV